MFSFALSVQIDCLVFQFSAPHMIKWLLVTGKCIAVLFSTTETIITNFLLFFWVFSYY